jgi:hypothetical protein
MYTGWMLPFPVNRPLTQEEKAAALPRRRQPDIEPDDHLSLVHFNSTYIDWIDRRFFYRGAFPICLGTLIELGFMISIVLLILKIFAYSDIGHVVPGLIGVIGIFLYVSIIWHFILRKEYFTYIWYPIRFNRKTRMVHVFRHNGPGGVLSVPWKEVYFHQGYGWNRKLRDIRGEILDGNRVKDTFALGHPEPESSGTTVEMWEFIRRYMDEGTGAVASSPLDKCIDMSVVPSLKNCYHMLLVYYMPGFPFLIQVFLFPLVLLYTLQRWLIFHTCHKPVFLPEVEDTCQVDPHDPNVWPIPRSISEFSSSERIARLKIKAEKRQQRMARLQQQDNRNLFR